MKKLIIIITMVIVANVTGFGSTVCNAELDGAAPLPKIEKSTGPTLEETTKWITKKFASLPPAISKNGLIQLLYVVSFDGCEMTVTEEETIKSRDSRELNIFYMQLREMDASDFSAVKNEYWTSLTLSTLGDLKVIRELWLDNVTLEDKEILDRYTVKGDNLSPNNSDWRLPHVITMSGKTIRVKRRFDHAFRINFNEIEEAESMSNAFKHAVKLCREKAAKDKAARPPKKKDLF